LAAHAALKELAPMQTTSVPTQPLMAYDTRGVLGSRIIAYLVDIVMIGLLTIVLGFVILLAGVLTLGLAWMVLPLLGLTGILYSTVTIGGYKQSTIGMRMMGLRVMRADGSPADWLTAAFQALLFYVALGSGVLLIADLVVGLINSDRRLLHDILSGLIVVRAR
jgi:uncharacterized RDD family membrane protein YckC